MWTHIRRLLPALAALTLLGAAALGASAPPRAVPDALVYPNCAITTQRSGGSSVWIAPSYSSVWQPLVPGGYAAACSLYVYGTYNQGDLTIQAWDPVALAPDPTSVALRSHHFRFSELTYGHERVDIVPPLVTRAFPGVADPPAAATALKLTLGSAGAGMYVSPEAPSSTPAGYSDTGGALTPLPGARGALAHWICGGDLLLENLYVMQAVSRTDTALDSVECYVQRFRVPERTEVYFVEMAFGIADPRFTGQGGTLAIIDGAGLDVPPTYLPTTLAQAVFSDPMYAPELQPSWGSHADFTTVAILEPAHDYWLWVEGRNYWRLYTRNRTGGESRAFNAGIGPLYRRGDFQSFAVDSARSLSFKIVGLPQTAIGVAVPPVPLVALALHVAPNPAPGLPRIRWAGARGAVRFDVLDARGRRISGGAGDGVTGEWTWPATAADGRPVPAGIYFVRASDASGATASERVVVLR